MHSHAPAQKSSGALLGVMDRERCRKRPSGRRIALRRSGEGRERDVMVNQADWHGQPQVITVGISFAFSSVPLMLIILRLQKG